MPRNETHQGLDLNYYRILVSIPVKLLRTYIFKCLSEIGQRRPETTAHLANNRHEGLHLIYHAAPKAQSEN